MRSAPLAPCCARRTSWSSAVSAACRMLLLRARRCRPATETLASRSEEHTSELQSLMRISYAVFCLKKKKKKTNTNIIIQAQEHTQTQTLRESTKHNLTRRIKTTIGTPKRI